MLLEKISAITGLALIIFSAYSLSSNKPRAKQNFPRLIGVIACQFFCAFILLRTSLGLTIIDNIAMLFTKLSHYGTIGTEFVFGELSVNHSQYHAPFIFTVLTPIIFISGLLGVLQWIGFLPWTTHIIGTGFSWLTHSGKLRGYFACAALIFGQELAPLSAKNTILHVPRSKLLPLGIASMATVSLSVVGAYIKIVPPRYVVVALILNLLGTFAITLLICPPEAEDFTELRSLDSSQDRESFFGVFTDYLLDGAKIASIVAVMLIGFTAALAMLNDIFTSVCQHSFQDLLGYTFAPFAFLVGVPYSEIHHIGTTMAMKIISNEFVAMKSIPHNLNEHTQAIITTFLVSFANFSSIGIVSGAFRAIDTAQGKHIAKNGVKILICANLINALSCLITGIIVS